METQNNTATLLLKSGYVVNSESGQISIQDILIENGVISAIAPEICVDKIKLESSESDDNIQIIDCTDKIVTPGFVDAHVHLESGMVLQELFAQAVLPHGTTCIISDPHEIVNVAGVEGLQEYLKFSEKSHLSIYTVIPSCVPATPYDTNGAGKFTAEQMKEFIDHPLVVGLGEVMSYHEVVNKNPEMMAKLALFKGKTIDGHTSGLDESLLDAYVSQGISNDHECHDEKGVLARYNKGMNIYIREGSGARNAKAILECILKHSLDISRFAFCTDDKHLSAIEREGHISYIVRMALSMGFTWGQIARMASYNPCKYYGLEKMGNLLPGYKADIVVMDLKCEHIDAVIKNGELVDENFMKRFEFKSPSKRPKNRVHLPELKEEAFTLDLSNDTVGMQLIDGQLLTNKIIVKAGTHIGPQAQSEDKVNILATVERHGKNGNIALCPLLGYGIVNGALATSVAHDSHNVVCAGDNPKDMVVACKRLAELGGGYVIASEGRVVEEFELPFYGLMSSYSIKDAIEGIRKVEKKAHDMGVNPAIDPMTTLSFTALPVIPTVRLMDTGLFDVINNTFITE